MDIKKRSIPPYRDRVSTQDLADMLGISKKTLYRWEAAHKIPMASRDPMNEYRYYTDEDLKVIEKATGRKIKK